MDFILQSPKSIKSPLGSMIKQPQSRSFQSSLTKITSHKPCSVLLSNTFEHLNNIPETTRLLCSEKTPQKSAIKSRFFNIKRNFSIQNSKAKSQSSIKMYSKPKFEKKVLTKNSLILSNSSNTLNTNLSKEVFPLKNNFLLQNLKTTNFLENKISDLSFRSAKGSKQGIAKPHNQDDLLIIKNFAKVKNQTLLGVFDGHGKFGHKVSSFVKAQLPYLVENSFPREAMGSIENSTQTLYKIKKTFGSSFINTHKALINKSTIDVDYSGTTAITVLIRGNYVICSNVGDSRGIIGKYDER